jgi:hypothetical protein
MGRSPPILLGVKLYLPNSAHLQNIEGFIRRYAPGAGSLRVSMHERYVFMHPAALAMAAAAGELATSRGLATTGRVYPVASLPYLIRMKLFQYLRLDPERTIQEHEEAGRFIPITRISNDDQLRESLVNLIPLLHAPPEVAQPIQYVFSEMVRNVLEHSLSPVGAFVCAQYYRDQRRIAIGVADAGVGIRRSLARSHSVPSDAEAILLSLRPGVTGVTRRLGGNEFNAGAGLFFTKSIAALSRNFFVLYSGDSMFKLQRGSAAAIPQLNPDPVNDNHKLTTGLPYWERHGRRHRRKRRSWRSLLGPPRYHSSGVSAPSGSGPQPQAPDKVRRLRISILELGGDFAENKDAAADVRESLIKPAVAQGKEVILDFTGVELSTQSFVHALTSEVLRRFGDRALELIRFKGCNAGVAGLVETVVQYSLDSVDDSDATTDQKAAPVKSKPRKRRTSR